MKKYNEKKRVFWESGVRIFTKRYFLISFVGNFSLQTPVYGLSSPPSDPLILVLSYIVIATWWIFLERTTPTDRRRSTGIPTLAGCRSAHTPLWPFCQWPFSEWCFHTLKNKEPIKYDRIILLTVNNVNRCCHNTAWFKQWNRWKK